MSNKEVNKHLSFQNSNKFELEPIMKFQELPLEKAMKMLQESGIFVSEEEASNILLFIHTIAKITIKEFLTSKD